MNQIKTLTLDTVEGQARDILQSTQAKFGFVPNLIGKMANAPALAAAYLAIGKLFEDTSFSPTEQQVVLLAVSRFHECTYCVAAHSTIAQMQNVPNDVVQAIRSDQPIADSKLESLRRLTTEIVEFRGRPGEQAVSDFLASGYSESQMLEVVLGVGMKTLSNYTNHLADTELDPAFAANAWKAE